MSNNTDTEACTVGKTKACSKKHSFKLNDKSKIWPNFLISIAKLYEEFEFDDSRSYYVIEYRGVE